MLKLAARYFLLTALALGAAACDRDADTDGLGEKAGPAATVRQSVELARQGDIAGLIEHMLPPAEFARIKAGWNERTDADEPSAAQRKQFAETMAKLTAPDAANALYAELEADLRQFDAQYQQQIPTIVAMGRGYLRGLVQQSQELSTTEKEQANGVIEALSQWVEKTRFTDPGKVKQALAIVSDTARRLDLKTLDQAQALDFEQSAPKLKLAFDGLKRVLEVYGLSIDQTLDSVRAEVISTNGDSATVKIAYTLLGTPLETRSEMVRIDGRWFARDTIDKLKQRGSPPQASAPVAVDG